MNICFSSAGRRVALMECFRGTLAALGVEGRLLAVDCSLASSAFHLADAAQQVPRCAEPEFIPTMLELCEREHIELIVPTIDTELPVYSGARNEFEALGVAVAISSPEVIEIAADKEQTHSWLTSHGLPTVRQAPAAELLSDSHGWEFPLIVKPVGGSASIGVQEVTTIEALRVAFEQRQDLVVQEIAPGDEYTINVFVNRAGKCVCAVPHKRLEVRAGEVSKGMTVKHRELMHLAREVVEALPGAYGALNIQCFLADDGTANIIEINPRFGGGYPLAYAAGADFPRWLLQEIMGQPVDAAFDQWQDNLVMLRYDEAVIIPGHRLGLAK